MPRLSAKARVIGLTRTPIHPADGIALSGMLDSRRAHSGLAGRDETAEQDHRADRTRIGAIRPLHSETPASKWTRLCTWGPDLRAVRPKPGAHFLRFLRGAPSETPSLEAC